MPLDFNSLVEKQEPSKDLNFNSLVEQPLKKKSTPLESSVTPSKLPSQDKFKQGLEFAQQGFKMPSVEVKQQQKEQGWLMNTVSALDKGFYKNLVGSPVKGLGTLLQGTTKKVLGGTGEGFVSDALIKFGDYFNNAIDELTPQDEQFKNTLTDEVAQALGQVGSMVLTGGVTGMGQKGAALAGGIPKGTAAINAAKGLGKDLINPVSVSAGLSMGQSEFEKAKDFGATDDEAFEVFYKNAAVGSVLEQIPTMQFLKRFNQSTSGGVAKYIATKGVAGITGGLEELSTEVLQQLYANKTAKDIYNINQNLFEGVAESGGVGFGVGFLLNALGANAKILRKQGKKEDAKIVEDQIEEFESKMEAETKFKENEDITQFPYTLKAKASVITPEENVAPNIIPPTIPATAPSVIMPEENIQPETITISPDQKVNAPSVIMPEANVAPEVIETKQAEIPADLEKNSEQIESTLEAERRRSNGERIFAITEQDEMPVEVASVEMLRNYTPDQLIAYKPTEEVKPEIKSKLEAFKTQFAPQPKEVTVSGAKGAETRRINQEAAKIIPMEEKSAVLAWLSGKDSQLKWEAINEAAGKVEGASLNVGRDFGTEEVKIRDYAAKDRQSGETLNDVVHSIWEDVSKRNPNVKIEDVHNELLNAIRENPTRAEAAKALVSSFGAETKAATIEEGEKAFYEGKGEQPTQEMVPVEFEGGFVPFQEEEGDFEEAPFAVEEGVTPEVQAMQEIVKDYINEGTTSLPEIKKAIAKQLGYNTRQLRQTIDDAYNRYTTSAEAAVIEVKSGLLGRIGNAFNKMFARDAQKPFISKDGKALEIKAKEIAETGGRPSFQITMPNGQSVTAKPVDASVVNGFYSPLELQLNQMKQDKMPAKQWLEKLRGEEAKWSGLSDWLSQQKESLTKDQIKNYLDTNKVEIFEIVKGAPNKLNEDQVRRLKYLEKLDKENPGGAIEDIEKGVFRDSSYDELLYLLNVRDASSYESLFEAQLEAEKKARIAQQAGLKKKADEYWDDSHRYTKRIEILELSPDGEGGIENPTKFSQYQLEGEKSDYREILITQPQKTILRAKDDVYYEAEAKLAELEKEQDKVDERYRQVENKIENLRDARGLVESIDRKNEINEKIQNLKTKRGEIYLEYSELGDKIFDQHEILNKYKKKLEEPKFLYTTHFDEANILVHLRTNMRKDVDGNTVFFAEEIQSDWGQKGREEGFKADSLTDQEKERLNELKDITSKKYAEFSFLQDAYQYTLDLGYGDYSYKNTEEFNKFLKSDENYRKEIINERHQQREKFYNNLIEANKEREKNPEIREAIVKSLEKQKSEDYEKHIEALFNIKRDSFDYDLYKKEVGEKGLLEEKKSKGEYGYNVAPFVTKTSDWTKLGIKTLLKEAVKSGASRFAWTNGDQQNDRWSLAKYIDELQVFRNGDNEFQLIGFNNGNSSFEQNVKATQLEDYIGKELSVKVLNDFATNKDMNDKVYSDNDFKIDGVGMRSFYGNPNENRLGVVGDIVKSLFKQDPKKLELKGSSKIDKLNEQLNDKKDQLFLLRKDIEILNKNPKYLEELQVRSNMLREEYFKNEDELAEVKQKIYRNTSEKENVNDIIYGKFFDERTLQINKEIDKYLNYEKEIRSNREYEQWNNELDRLANEKKEIIAEYVNRGNELDNEYKELKDERDRIQLKSNSIEAENMTIKSRIREIKDAPANEKKILKKIKYFEDEISKGVPMQWYVDITPEVKQQAQQGLPMFMANSSGADVLGFSFNNKMYLNGEKLNPNTIIHEAGHIWVEWARKNATEIYAKGMELVEKSPYLQKAKNSKFYQEQAAKLTTEQEREDYFKHEALAMAIGDKGAQFVVESKKASFKDWLNTLWSKIKNLTGFKDLTAEEFQNLTFEEFSKMAVKEILGVENNLDKFNAFKSFRSKKNFVKSNLKYESNKNAIDELDFTEEDLVKIVKANFDLSTFKNIKNAVQERSAKKVLQRPQGGVGEGRGGRKRVEPRVQGEEIAGEGEITQPESVTQIPDEIENVGLDNGDVDYVGITEADLNNLRKSLGLPKYQGLPMETHDMLRDIAQKMIKEGVSVESLYNKIRDGIALSNYENAFMGEYRAALDAELRKNPSKELLAKIKEFADNFQVGASLAGKALESLKIVKKLNEANTLSNFLLSRQEDKGYPLTGKMIADETAKFEKLQDAKDKLQESSNNDILEQVKVEVKKEPKKSHDEYVKERKEALAAAKEALDKLKKDGNLYAIPVPGIPQLIAVAPHMNKYVKSLYSEGISKLDDIVTEVHKEFSGLIDGLTKRDVLDVISGKYATKRRTVDEANAGLRLLRREANLLLQLEKARKNEEEADTESKIAKTSLRVEQLEEKIKQVRELNKAKEKSEEGVAENSPSIDGKTDKEYNERRQKFLNKKIKQLEDDIKNKKFDKEPAQAPTYKISDRTKRMMERVAELEKDLALARFKDQQLKMSKWEKGWNAYKNVMGLRRIVQTAIDASIWFRQLAKLSMNPRKWNIAMKFIKAGAQSVFSQKNYDRLMYQIHQAPDYKESLEDGVKYNDIGTPNELYPTSFLYNIPLIKQPFLASQRIADASINVARYELYNKYKRELVKQGITRESDPEIYKGLGKAVMNSTGSGNMLKFLESKAGQETMGAVFYGAKLMASNFNTLNPAYYAKLPEGVRAEVMKDLASYTATVMSVMLALVAAGGRVSVDPDDPDFLQVRFGEKVYDITAGQAAYIRTFLRWVEAGYAVAAESKFEASEKSAFAWNSTLRFFRNKLAPNNAYIVNAWTQENSIGQDFDPMEIFHLYPMYADDAYKAAKEDGIISLFTVLLPNMLGQGYSSYYSDKALKPMDEIINLAKDSDEMNPITIRKDITKDEFKQFAKLRDKLIEEKIKDLYKEGIFDEETGEQIPIKKSTSEQISKAISKLKRKATTEAKSEFNADYEEEE